ncbi:MAG: rRNA pseudouridine synthase [Anaerolineae bacterium]|nr:rRNA pseudouridine synthase [Anaerolineae bacterium]
MYPPHRSDQTKPEKSVSLPRALSKLGYCSRSQARDLVLAGRVQVNRVTRDNPSTRIDMNRDSISVDGRQISASDRVYLMLNKPRGLVTTTSDDKNRDTVYHCLDDHLLPWVFPVGRLDKASEGLLLFTNDTQWAAGVIDPATHVQKTYHVQVNRLIDDAILQRLLAGVTDGTDHLRAREARLLRHGSRNSWLEIIIDAGKNRHIRRMLSAVGLDVLRLVRTAIGPLRLGNLAKGEFRRLTQQEQTMLDVRNLTHRRPGATL